jgi:hypothetical protein
MPNLPASLLHFAATGACTIEPATANLSGDLKNQLHASALGR